MKMSLNYDVKISMFAGRPLLCKSNIAFGRSDSSKNLEPDILAGHADSIFRESPRSGQAEQRILCVRSSRNYYTSFFFVEAAERLPPQVSALTTHILARMFHQGFLPRQRVANGQTHPSCRHQEFWWCRTT